MDTSPSRAAASVGFFFNDTATTEIYTLSLHDALPISPRLRARRTASGDTSTPRTPTSRRDRKSTRLNSSHQIISYAVFCLKQKKFRFGPQIREFEPRLRFRQIRLRKH